MPTREAIVETALPKDVPKPIPVRTVQTRDRRPGVAGNPVAAQNGNQLLISEANPAAVSATTEEPVRLSGAASALARKEQAFRQREQAFKAQEQQFAALKEKAEKFDLLTQKMSAKDYSEAEKLGLDYEAYVQYKLAQAGGDDPLAQKIATLEQTISDLKKGQEESVEQAYGATLGEYRKEVSQLIEVNPEFSSIKYLGKDGVEAVMQLIVDSWEEDSLEMTAEQACKDIENEIMNYGKKFSELPKLKPAKTETTEENVATPPPRVGTNTLSNNMAPPSGLPANKPLQFLSDDQRYAEARRRVLARRAQQQGS